MTPWPIKIITMVIALGSGFLVWLLLEIFLFKDCKEEDEELEKQGCHCHKTLFYTETSPECPVHGNQSVIQNLTDCNGDPYVNFPYVSQDRVPICMRCMKEKIQDRFELYYHRRVVGTENDKEWPNGCVLCGASTYCAMVPKNIVKDWGEGRIFHFTWKEV